MNERSPSHLSQAPQIAADLAGEFAPGSPRLILASGSPRRQELLREAGYLFTVEVADLDEHAYIVEGDPDATAIATARAKAEAVAQEHPDAIVLGGDTVVAVEEAGGWTLLGKPVDVADAKSMLGRLQGREHKVVTGVAVVGPSGGRSAQILTEAATTLVKMRPLREEEIEAYVATGEPMDKAGSYAIQGALQPVQSIEGPYDNVVGLPMQVVEGLLGRLEFRTADISGRPEPYLSEEDASGDNGAIV